MGGIALASGVMGAMGASKQAKADAMAQQMQQQNANFQNKWQNEAANRNMLRQYQGQLQVNAQIETAANLSKVQQGIYGKAAWNNASSQLSKQTNTTTSSFLGAMSARGISLDSANVRSMVRQTAAAAQVNNANMRVSFANQGRDIDTSYQNMLAKRNLGVPEQQTFMPSRGGIVDNSSSMLSTGIATSVLNAAGAAYSANKQWGTPSAPPAPGGKP